MLYFYFNSTQIPSQFYVQKQCPTKSFADRSIQGKYRRLEKMSMAGAICLQGVELSAGGIFVGHCARITSSACLEVHETCPISVWTLILCHS